MPDTRVLLIRHAQSEWNAAGRWQGQADPPLTDLGRSQSRSAARALGSVDVVWASDLQRAIETALIIAEELGLGPVVSDRDFREREVGPWSGLTRAQIEDRFPGYLESGRRPPGWESDRALADRAARGLCRVGARHPGGEVLVVTHAGVIFGIERRLGADQPRLANGEGRRIVVSGETLQLGERVTLNGDSPVTVPEQL